jgi:hypothetical protein
VLKSPLYHNAAHFPRAFNIHPLNYALGLAAAAEKAGARIFENTPALSIDPAGIRKRVVTPSARVRATHVVLAGNTKLGGLMPQLAGTLLPVTTYVATTAPLGPRLAEIVAFSGGITDTERADNHYRVVEGDRLLWSGGMTTWESDPRRFIKRLAADIKRTFPQLGDVAIEHIWSGTLGNAVHKMPQIGEISRGLWIASAFGGHGFNTTAMAGELIGRGIVEGDQSWRLFSPYDLVWAGGALGRAAVQVGYWAGRIVEVVQANLAPKEKPVAAAQEAARSAPDIAVSASHPVAAPSMVPAEAAGALLEAEPVAGKSKRKKPPPVQKAPPRKRTATAKKRAKPPATGAHTEDDPTPEETASDVKQSAEGTA